MPGLAVPHFLDLLQILVIQTMEFTVISGVLGVILSGWYPFSCVVHTKLVVLVP
uniref:Uncharacterized protein n=1 Tax=Nelumbo nucifera TaxID=4432 RepID=A0A822YI93_NELNU|nr:TPA_asm: hypothetical protein HUJ06_009497 [Nelumbo nucifera]